MVMLCIGESMVVMLGFASRWEHERDVLRETLDLGWLRPRCCFLW